MKAPLIKRGKTEMSFVECSAFYITPAISLDAFHVSLIGLFLSV